MLFIMLRSIPVPGYHNYEHEYLMLISCIIIKGTY